MDDRLDDLMVKVIVSMDVQMKLLPGYVLFKPHNRGADMVTTGMKRLNSKASEKDDVPIYYDDEGVLCCITQSKVPKFDYCVKTPCGHTFGFRALTQWIKAELDRENPVFRCPLCKSSLNAPEVSS